MSKNSIPSVKTKDSDVCRGDCHIFPDKAHPFSFTGGGRVAPWRLHALRCQCGLKYTQIRGNGLGQRKPLSCIGTSETLTEDEIIERLECEAAAVTARVEQLKAGGRLQHTHRHGDSDGRLGIVGRNHAAKR